MSSSPVPTWSARLLVRHLGALTGDRIKLPPSVLEQILAEAGPDATLPSPLTFELVNGRTRRKIYGAVREFTAEEGEVAVGTGVAVSLGIVMKEPTQARVDDAMDLDEGLNGDGRVITGNGTDGDSVLVRLVALPKGKSIKLAPLDPDYLDISDMRSTLESHMRKHYATLTQGETLTVLYLSPQTHLQKHYQFLITDLNPSPACVIIDTDLEVDIEPLDQSLAEEAVKRKLNLSSSSNSSFNDNVKPLIWNGVIASMEGTVAKDEYQYYRISTQADHKYYTVKVVPGEAGDADLFVSTQTDKPTMRDHEYYNVDMGASRITFAIQPDTPFIYVGVHGFAPKSKFTVIVTADDKLDVEQEEEGNLREEEIPGPDYEQCPNCRTYVPTRTIMMHRAFCERNNGICGWCGKVMKKDDLETHWHCEEPGCDKVGHITQKPKHHLLIHTPIPCTCGTLFTLPNLSTHRQKTCPDRLITCPFCHLRVRAGPPSFSSKDLLLSVPLSEHESECGSRTITCIKCSKNVMMKEVRSHMAWHEMERERRKIWRICANWECSGKEVEGDGRNGMGNVMRVCRTCFGPFWSGRVDEGNKKLVNKVVGVYFGQLTKGCGREFCENKYCATSKNKTLLASPMSPTDAAILALDLLKKGAILNPSNQNPEYHFCVSDPVSHRRRKVADGISEMGWEVAWCVEALRECGDSVEGAMEWLGTEAPRRK